MSSSVAVRINDDPSHLRLRYVEEVMQERGVFVDHSTMHHWATKILQVLATAFGRRKRSGGSNWRMDETYIKVAGQWKYLYRAVDKSGDTVDFLLTAKRDKAAAGRFLERAIDLHDVPEKIIIDKSGADTAATESVNVNACTNILMRQNKYLNNLVEQDHQAVKRVTGPILGFKSFWSARILIAGMKAMHMLKKEQMSCPDRSPMSIADRSYSLAI